MIDQTVDELFKEIEANRGAKLVINKWLAMELKHKLEVKI
jgi:hypothetical protein